MAKRLYVALLLLLPSGAMAALCWSSQAPLPAREPDLRAWLDEVAGAIDGVGELSAPRLELDDRLQVRLPAGLTWRGADGWLSAASAGISLKRPPALYAHDLAGAYGGTAARLGLLELEPGRLVADHLRATGSLAARRLDSIEAESLVAPIADFQEVAARWREHPVRALVAAGSDAARGASEVRVQRLRLLDSVARTVALEQIELTLASGWSITVKRATGSPAGGRWRCSEVEVAGPSLHRTFAAMEFDPEGLTLSAASAIPGLRAGDAVSLPLATMEKRP
jgi:hypothetical protein